MSLKDAGSCHVHLERPTIPGQELGINQNYILKHFPLPEALDMHRLNIKIAIQLVWEPT
jgi:hypothetical protein